MPTIGRAALTFVALMAIAYIAVVALLPRPVDAAWRPDDVGGRIAADRLTAEAKALASNPSTSATLQ